MTSTIQVFIDNKTASGHFYTVVTQNGVPITFGYHPAHGLEDFPNPSSANTLIGPGEVRFKDNDYKYTYKSAPLPISEKGADAAIKFGLAKQSDPGIYRLVPTPAAGTYVPSYNCVDFVQDVLHHAGVPQPVGTLFTTRELNSSWAARDAGIAYGDLLATDAKAGISSVAVSLHQGVARLAQDIDNLIPANASLQKETKNVSGNDWLGESAPTYTEKYNAIPSNALVQRKLKNLQGNDWLGDAAPTFHGSAPATVDGSLTLPPAMAAALMQAKKETLCTPLACETSSSEAVACVVPTSSPMRRQSGGSQLQ